MSVFFIILPLAIVMAAVALAAFIRSTQRGQYDDLETPPWRVIFSESESQDRK